MSTPSADNHALPARLRAWEDFWFKPADPAKLALIRILCGMIVVYTYFIYGFKLQDFMGEHAWHDLQFRMETVEERPVAAQPLNWYESGLLPKPKDKFQLEYLHGYRLKWGNLPPPPYPTSEEEIKYLDEYMEKWRVDLRINGLVPSLKEEDKAYVERYSQHRRTPPPAYVKDAKEEKAVNEYIDRQGYDPRKLYAKGMGVFSLWFHVLDPQAMAILHGVMVTVAVLFTLGFCTRITSALLWFGSLCYIHRNPTILFGVDTMMTILLLYLMIAPCGAIWSLDRVMARWWVRAKPGVVAAWYRFWNKPVPVIAPAAPVPNVPEPSVSANVAIRLLQIHVCIIYAMAGLSKLLGQAWWNGTAIWMTVGNYEFAPMHSDLYMKAILWLGSYQLLYDAFMTGGGLFTLVFEIAYPFLIWRPWLRWFFLASAILLHGGIGLLMGLKTFSLMMLVMNMAFLRPDEVYWLVERFTNPKLLWTGGRAPAA